MMYGGWYDPDWAYREYERRQAYIESLEASEVAKNPPAPQPEPEPEITIEFCVWLQNEFDRIVAEINTFGHVVIIKEEPDERANRQSGSR